MNATQTIALNNAIETKVAKAARDAVEVGKHQVDFLVRVTGTLNVAEDTEKVPTVSIPVKEVLALFIARSGCTREASIALLRECMTDALKDGTKGVGAVEAAADIDEVFKAEVAALTASLPKTPVKGKVTTKLTVTECSATGGINTVTGVAK
jgi:hypothetical protein